MTTSSDKTEPASDQQPETDRYAALDSQTFDRILHSIVTEAGAHTLISIPGIYEVLSEHYNNQVLEEWEAEKELTQEEFKTWKIYYAWEGSTIVEVQATTLDEAIEKVEDNPPHFSPEDCDSADVNRTITESLNSHLIT